MERRIAAGPIENFQGPTEIDEQLAVEEASDIRETVQHWAPSSQLCQIKTFKKGSVIRTDVNGKKIPSQIPKNMKPGRSLLKAKHKVIQPLA